MKLRHWAPRSVPDYIGLGWVAVGILGWVGLFLQNIVLIAVTVGAFPGLAVSSYWWHKQASARTKLMAVLLWMKHSPFEDDLRAIERSPNALNQVSALAILHSHASYGRRMKEAAERAERDLRENAWSPYVMDE